MIKEVTVSSKRKFIQNKIDKKVVDVSQLATAAGSNASEILGTLPSVKVDIDGNVSLRGNSDVKILVDGRESGLSASEILQQIPADGIETIEIITNPSAKYDPEGMAGIINIILKKGKLIGFNGSANISSGFGTFNKSYGTKINNTNSTGLNLNYRNGDINVFGNIQWRNSQRDRYSRDTSRTKYLDSISLRRKISDIERFRNILSGRLGIDYYFDDKNIITLSTTIRNSIRDQNEKSDNKYKEFKDVKNPKITNKKWLTNENSKDSYFSKYYLLAHEIEFKDESKLISDIIYEQQGSDDSQNISYSEKLNIDDLTAKKTYIDQTRSNFILKSDYTNEFNENMKIEAGARVDIERVKRDYLAKKKQGNDFIKDTKISNIFKYDENIYSVYGIFMQKLELGFSYQLGLKVENVKISSILENSNENIPNNNYFSFYPSINLEQEISENSSIQLNYSRRVRRPSIRYLNPFWDYSDPLNIFVGNPYLSPTYTNSIELGYSYYWEKSSIMSSIFYHYMTDNIAFVTDLKR